MNGPAFADYEGTEVVGFQAARRWWGRSLLRAPRMPDGTNTESVLVQSDAGLRGNPRADYSGVAVVYLDKELADVRHNTYFGIIETGAFTVEVVTYPAGVAAPAGYEPTTVRGRPGWYNVIYKNPPEGNADYQTVSWLQPGADGTSEAWRVASSPRIYTKDQLIAFANSLAET